LNQYKHRINIAGNHDRLHEFESYYAKTLVPKNVIYLEDSGRDIDGYYFYGSPVQLPFNDWAFNRPEEKLKQHWEAIPDYTDVLITHSPPFGILDCSPLCGHYGSPSLTNEVLMRVKPKVHCFGHIHYSHGIHEQDNIKFINASILDDGYEIVFEPIVIEI